MAETMNNNEIKVQMEKGPDGKNVLEIKNMHTYFYMDSGVVKSVDGVDIELREGSTLGIVARISSISTTRSGGNCGAARFP